MATGMCEESTSTENRIVNGGNARIKSTTVDPAVVQRIKAHPLFPALQLLHLKVQLGMECSSDEKVYDINDVVQIIASTRAPEEYDEVDVIIRESLCNHAVCLRDLSFVVAHTDVFLETNKQSLKTRAPMDSMWKGEGGEEEEEGSPVESPIDNRVMEQGIIEFMQRRLLEQMNGDVNQAVKDSLISNLLK